MKGCCYYLQERGLLTRFHRQFVVGHEKDTTGYATLKTVLGKPNMEAFQKEWSEFVSGLEFP